MYGGVLGRTSLSLALGVLVIAAVAPALAADLGGDCCADLDERISELEATTATKGNRKVSLEISGHVNQAILFWDDGSESNAYLVTNDNERTRFRFKGKAKISADLEAGYAIEIGVRTANSKRFTQDNPEGASASDVGFDLRDSYWYLKSKSLGRFSLGRQATATDKITEINLTQTSSFAKYSDVEDTGLGLILRSSANGGFTNSGITWRRLIGDGGDQPGEGERRFDAVKYVSPEFAGFAVSAAWGEDDYWDVALNYEGEHAGFKIAAGIGYGEISDTNQTQTVCAAQARAEDIGLGSDTDCRQFGGSVSLLHEASGLFINFGAGAKTDDLIEDTVRFGGTGVDDAQTFWAVQAGIEKKFFEFGKTTVYGEYYDYEGGGATRRTIGNGDALNPTGNAGDSWAVWGSGVNVIGAGLAQGIDKAAMVLYLSYRHVEGDLTLRELNGNVASGTIADAPLEDLDLVLTGAIIKF
ncbi:MAG: porin [Hyphomicrobiaceae bacterium]